MSDSREELLEQTVVQLAALPEVPPEYRQAEILVQLRKLTSLRNLAATFGMSKSTLHRQWPAIELQAEAYRLHLSRMGQSVSSVGENPPPGDGGVSHAGQPRHNGDGGAS